MIRFAPLLLWAPTLFDQSVVRTLTRDFPQAQFVLVDVAGHQVIGSRFDSSEALPLGSLVKPFLALAFDSGNLQCDPSRCWLRSGHGVLGLEQAIAESCNSYFLQKAEAVTPQRMDEVAARFQLPPPPRTAEGRIGLGGEWRIPPDRMALAYAMLVRARDAQPILSGMRQCARSGTGVLVAVKNALAKTGTAPCSHTRKAPGDGYVAIMYPADSPKYVLLVQMHGVSGAETARTAGAMLRVLRHGV